MTTTDETGITSSSMTNDKIQTLTEQIMILHKIIAALSKILGASFSKDSKKLMRFS
ncbi:MAG: hypothetical protein Q4B66_05450 [Ligilactobacillus agilis]|nr:hypothetical protein [Ligilactobacillus agilis]